jgi:hypothetical protein
MPRFTVALIDCAGAACARRFVPDVGVCPASASLSRTPPRRERCPRADPAMVPTVGIRRAGERLAHCSSPVLPRALSDHFSPRAHAPMPRGTLRRSESRSRSRIERATAASAVCSGPASIQAFVFHIGGANGPVNMGWSRPTWDMPRQPFPLAEPGATSQGAHPHAVEPEPRLRSCWIPFERRHEGCSFLESIAPN